jgi:hypothetical protein
LPPRARSPRWPRSSARSNQAGTQAGTPGRTPGPPARSGRPRSS